ncbi:uncharacterized protein DUF4437 [Flavobacteriaceae bacterium MAR_2009_75]|nr:uncharacterized protein DUF4437 [Flavobacteriaceae bacterium MAR_2009_75]
MVIKGLLHNDDENAENNGFRQVLIGNSQQAKHILPRQMVKIIWRFLDIQEGPYLVKSTSEAFDNGERPVNVDKTNLVWLNANDIEWVANKSNVETAFLWGSQKEKQLRATLLKLPAGFNGSVKNLSPNFRAVVISGSLMHQFSKKEAKNKLDAPSYFGAEENATSIISTAKETVLYIRSNGDYEVK